MNVWFTCKSFVKDEQDLLDIVNSFNSSESTYCLKYVFLDDKIRSALSILLQRAVIRSTFNIDDSMYQILRTREVIISFPLFRSWLISLNRTNLLLD